MESHFLLQDEVEMFHTPKCSSSSRLYHPRPFRADKCGEDRAMPRGLPACIRALHQLPQAQHSPLLAQAADEGDGSAHDRSLPRQPLPAYEGGVSQRTLSPALPGSL